MDARCSGRNTQRMAAAGRPKWSWLYLCVLMWLATITVPEYFLLSRWASDPDRGDFGQPVGSWLYIFLAVATVALGCAHRMAASVDDAVAVAASRCSGTVSCVLGWLRELRVCDWRRADPGTRSVPFQRRTHRRLARNRRGPIGGGEESDPSTGSVRRHPVNPRKAGSRLTTAMTATKSRHRISTVAMMRAHSLAVPIALVNWARPCGATAARRCPTSRDRLTCSPESTSDN